jgi:S-phase kinase-associated protein 1
MAVAKMSQMVASFIEDDDDTDKDVPITNVKAIVLSKVIDYCTHYQEEPMTPITTPLKSSRIEDLVQPWYANFVQVEPTMMFELVTAANYMDIKSLLDLTCLAVSIYIKGKSAEELRRIFNISDEFSPEEEEQVRAENSWAETAQPQP